MLPPPAVVDVADGAVVVLWLEEVVVLDAVAEVVLLPEFEELAHAATRPMVVTMAATRR